MELEVNFMTSGNLFLLGAALLLCGCGSSFQAGRAIDDDGGGDARDDAWEASADVETGGPGDSGADTPADVAHDAPELDSSPFDAAREAAPCTPPTFPLPNPCGGTGITMPGAVWLYQSQATPPMCFVYTLDEAGTACQQCASSFNCACIDPDGGLLGVTCVNTSSGCYLSQN